jgi:hypothetical protein
MPSREETETIILLNDGEEFAIVDTMHGRFRRACERIIEQMGRGRELNLDAGRRSGKKVRWAFEIPAECVSVPRPPRRLSDEQRAAAAARGRAIRSRQLRNTGLETQSGPTTGPRKA